MSCRFAQDNIERFPLWPLCTRFFSNERADLCCNSPCLTRPLLPAYLIFFCCAVFAIVFFCVAVAATAATAQQQTVTQPTSFHHIVVLALCATVPRILGTHLNLNNYAILFYAQVVPSVHIACRRCHANYSLTWTSASRCHSKLLYDYCHWACNLLYAALAYNRWL